MNMTRYCEHLLTVTAAVTISTFSTTAVGDDTEHAQRICTVIDSMGAALECAINEAEHSVDLTADTGAVDPIQMCTALSGMVEALTHYLTGDWKMRVFSNQDSDIPAATCKLG